jgi:cytochrome c553
MIKFFLICLLFTKVLFSTEIIVDESLSLSDKRFIDKLLGKEIKPKYTQVYYSEPSDVVSSQTEEPSQEFVQNSRGGQRMFKACSACHGQYGDKHALGKSAIIKNLSSAEIYRRLKGYKNKTYGRAMAGIMYGQVQRYNDEELESLAQYISNL